MRANPSLSSSKAVTGALSLISSPQRKHCKDFVLKMAGEQTPNPAA